MEEGESVEECWLLAVAPLLVDYLGLAELSRLSQTSHALRSAVGVIPNRRAWERAFTRLPMRVRTSVFLRGLGFPGGEVVGHTELSALAAGVWGGGKKRVECNGEGTSLYFMKMQLDSGVIDRLSMELAGEDRSFVWYPQGGAYACTTSPGTDLLTAMAVDFGLNAEAVRCLAATAVGAVNMSLPVEPLGAFEACGFAAVREVAPWIDCHSLRIIDQLGYLDANLTVVVARDASMNLLAVRHSTQDETGRGTAVHFLRLGHKLERLVGCSLDALESRCDNDVRLLEARIAFWLMQHVRLEGPVLAVGGGDHEEYFLSDLDEGPSCLARGLGLMIHGAVSAQGGYRVDALPRRQDSMIRALDDAVLDAPEAGEEEEGSGASSFVGSLDLSSCKIAGRELHFLDGGSEIAVRECAGPSLPPRWKAHIRDDGTPMTARELTRGELVELSNRLRVKFCLDEISTTFRISKDVAARCLWSIEPAVANETR